MSPPYIPFNKPFFCGNEFDYITEGINQGYIAGDGPFAKKCEELLKKSLTVPEIFLTTSCTHALEMAGMLLNIQPGDEVIIPSYTFPSTVNAFILRGAKPVFIDIRPDTLNLDESLLERHFSPRTKCIVPVHYAGVGCAMDSIQKVANKHGIAIVEDNAHGLFGKYQGQFLGTFGNLATQSFHETKNFICGEGGALLINDPQLIDRAEIIREKGTNRKQFFRGMVDKYTWKDIGSSYVMSDILAAFLYAQLKKREFIQSKRQNIWDFYYRSLKNWAQNSGVTLPHVPDDCEQTYHLFYLLMPNKKTRDEFISKTKEQNIACIFHYIPLHQSDMGKSFGGKKGDCPVAESISDRLVRLPLFPGLTKSDQERIVSVIENLDLDYSLPLKRVS